MSTCTLRQKLLADLHSAKSRFVKLSINKFRSLLRGAASVLSYIVVLLPGSFFCALGAVTFVYPQHANEMFALALLFAGVVLSVLGYRLIQLRMKFEALLESFNGKVFVQGIRVEPASDSASANSAAANNAREQASAQFQAAEKNFTRANSATRNVLKVVSSDGSVQAGSTTSDGVISDGATDSSVLAEFNQLAGSKKVTVH